METQVGTAQTQEPCGGNDSIVMLLVRVQLGKVMVWRTFRWELYPLSTGEPPPAYSLLLCPTPTPVDGHFYFPKRRMAKQLGREETSIAKGSSSRGLLKVGCAKWALGP